MSKFQKPVVFSFISPDDSLIVVYVDFSISPYADIDSSTSTAVSGARVVISNAQTSVQLVQSVPGVYVGRQREFRIQHGNTYKLEVQTPNGFSVHSFCTVPSQEPYHFQVTNLSIDTTSPKIYVYTAKVKITWSSKYPYYRIAMASKQTYQVRKIYTYNDSTGEYSSILDTNQYVEYRKVYWNLDNNTELVSVNEFYGSSANGKVFVNFFLDEGEISSFDLLVSILTVDTHYFNYFKSREAYTEPNFFTEPTLIYSNIQGGYGCFGAYTAQRLVYNFK